MSVLPDLTATPQRRHIHRLDQSFRVKRIRSRHVFRVDPLEDGTMRLTPLAGGPSRTCSAEALEAGFVRVTRCSSCGWHHDVTKQVRKGCRG